MSRGNFIYVYIVPLGLINIFLHVKRDGISCRLQPTRFFPKNLFKNYIIVKKGEISDLFLGKFTYVIKKVIKLHITHYYGYFNFSRSLSYERLKTYLQTGAQEISVILGHFEAAITQKRLEKPG